MTFIASLVRAAGGLLHKRDLVRSGATDRHLTTAVRSGSVRRPRRGWYSTWAPDDPRFLAVRVGGRLTGLSALQRSTPWRWDRDPPSVTVSVARNSSRLRRLPGIRVVWDGPGVRASGNTWRVGAAHALARAVLESPFEEAVALIDWVMRTFALTRGELLTAIEHLPDDARGVLEWADPRCDSFPESIARTRLRCGGHAVRSQFPLPNSQRVDLVVDDVVGLEIDGFEHHADAFEPDRRKDLLIAGTGLVPLRATVSTLRSRWDELEAAVVRLTSEPGGRHAKARRRRVLDTRRRTNTVHQPTVHRPAVHRGRSRTRTWRLAPMPATTPVSGPARPRAPRSRPRTEAHRA